MDLNAICDLPVGDLADESAHLWTRALEFAREIDAESEQPWAVAKLERLYPEEGA
jgi:hypothetical protein